VRRDARATAAAAAAAAAATAATAAAAATNGGGAAAEPAAAIAAASASARALMGWGAARPMVGQRVGQLGRAVAPSSAADYAEEAPQGEEQPAASGAFSSTPALAPALGCCALVAAGSFCSIGIALDDGATSRGTRDEDEECEEDVDVSGGWTAEREAGPALGAAGASFEEAVVFCGVEVLAASGPRVVMAKSGVP